MSITFPLKMRILLFFICSLFLSACDKADKADNTNPSAQIDISNQSLKIFDELLFNSLHVSQTSCVVIYEKSDDIRKTPDIIASKTFQKGDYQQLTLGLDRKIKYTEELSIVVYENKCEINSDGILEKTQLKNRNALSSVKISVQRLSEAFIADEIFVSENRFQVLISSVIVDKPFWLIIQTTDSEREVKLDDIIGLAKLNPGSYQNLIINLNKFIDDKTLYVRLVENEAENIDQFKLEESKYIAYQSPESGIEIKLNLLPPITEENCVNCISSEFTHQNTTTTCISCHNDQSIISSKSGFHISSTDDCGICHQNFESFLSSPLIDHSAVIGTCSTCHNATIEDRNDLPDFKTDIHPEYINGCASCHNGAIAKGPSSEHFTVSIDDCTGAGCHAATDETFIQEKVFVDHSLVLGGCAICHDGLIAITKSESHIASSSLCESCHLKNTSIDWIVVKSNVDHSQLTGNCKGCHDGVIVSGVSEAHLQSSDECSLCHSPDLGWNQTITTHASDYATACKECHYENNGALRSFNQIFSTEQCTACHKFNNYTRSNTNEQHHQQTNVECINCHDNSGIGKSSNHLQTSDNCKSCHVVLSWRPVIRLDHSQTIGLCISCHDGDMATGKGSNHIQSPDDCNSCHTVLLWRPAAKVDHEDLSDICIDCHNDIIAHGKTNTHLATTDDCNSCHTSIQWGGSNVIDHSQTFGTCISCHSTEMSIQHINATGNCAACHDTGYWVPELFMDHEEVLASCFVCHNNIVRPGKSATHIETSNICVACHLPTDVWQTVFTIDHEEIVGSCIECHNGVDQTGKNSFDPHMNTSDNCQACHATTATDWKPVIVVDHVEIIDPCESCHNETAWPGKSITHLPTSNLCDACHSTAAWLPTVYFEHNETDSACSDCHLGDKGFLHINTSDTCAICHFTTSWLPILSVDHLEINNVYDCFSCHNSVIADGKSDTHLLTTNQCGACHPTNSWVAITVNHREVTGICRDCHDGTIARGMGVAHIQILNPYSCDACHGTGSWAAITVNHSQVGDLCSACHAKSTTHIPVSSQCDACHSSTVWMIVNIVDHTQTLGTCNACHDGSIAEGKGISHIASTDNCKSCHRTTSWIAFAVDHNDTLGTCETCHSPPGDHIATGVVSGCQNCHGTFTWANATQALP